MIFFLVLLLLLLMFSRDLPPMYLPLLLVVMMMSSCQVVVGVVLLQMLMFSNIIPLPLLLFLVAIFLILSKWSAYYNSDDTAQSNAAFTWIRCKNLALMLLVFLTRQLLSWRFQCDFGLFLFIIIKAVHILSSNP